MYVQISFYDDWEKNIIDSFYKCDCCCQGGQCGQLDPSKGCDLYGTTLKYTGTAPSKCDLDNPQNPDLAVFTW